MRILIDEIMLNQKIKINQNDALIIIDVQNDFCPNGALAVPNGDQIIEPINKTIPLFKHIILSQDWHPRDHKSLASNHKDKNPFQTLSMPYGEQILWPDHCIIGTSGAKFHPALNVNLAQCVIRKGYNREIDSYSTFFENDKISPTGLAGYLRENNIKRIFLVGLAFEYCVGFSAIDGAKLGFEVYLLMDAIGCFRNHDFNNMDNLLTKLNVVTTGTDKLFET